MPIYEYDCIACGDFTALRSMVERDQPCPCPVCGGNGNRVILSAPGLTTLKPSQRRAHETNERSRHAPQSLAEFQQNRQHPAGCNCCTSSKSAVSTRTNPHALKGKPSGRPWMISH